ncbi:hypothetical protein EON63_13020 [archaeon]|nr:MAG: hypothetical protein EON63_13020 [archaeon]
MPILWFLANEYLRLHMLQTRTFQDMAAYLKVNAANAPAPSAPYLGFAAAVTNAAPEASHKASATGAWAAEPQQLGIRPFAAPSRTPRRASLSTASAIAT